MVGGGISGLTAAFYLERAGLAVAVLEAGPRVGGALDTSREGGWLVELGPNTVAARASLSRLLGDCGLEPEVLPASPLAARRFLWRDGELHAMPASPLEMLGSSLLTWSGKLQLAREPWVPARAADAGEESVAAFVRRRFGDEALAVFAAPFVAGIHAGDPERLSMRWALPRLLALEQRHGSVLRGARAAKRAGVASLRQPVVSLREGMHSLPERLAAAVGEVHRDARVDAVRREAGGYVIESTAGVFHAPRVVVAVPAPQAACLLHPASEGASAPLAELPYAPMAVVALGYARADVPHPLDGFGFLAATGSGLRLLGCLFSSTLFPMRAPEGHVLLTCFLGGQGAPELPRREEAELVRIAGEDLALTLGVRGEPVHAVVRRWPRAIPQYEVGHGRFVALASELETALPGLRLAGNWLRGIGVGDCVEESAVIAAALSA